MLDLKKIELEIKDFWRKNKIQEKLESKNKGKKNYFLLDGPPYANFTPHVGHIKNTVFKDLLIRLAIMKGHDVLFNPGFDTHGLPVENMVEQKLSLKSKKDIEEYGVAKFMKECKNSATLNKRLWMEVYEKLGSVYAGKKPYITYENDYIESAWWAFSEMHKKGLVYEGEKPVMWCPRCETSLAGYEITDSYKEVTDPGVYVFFKLKDSDENLLVFTTTPWTLPSNVAIAVAPKEDYVTVNISGKKIILAKKRLEKLSEMGFGYKIVDEFKGEKLTGKAYVPLLDVPLQRELSEGKHGKAHVIIPSISILKERVASKIRTKKETKGKDIFEEFVTVNEGTGLVHTAPGHGKTDNLVGQHYRLAAVSPLDDKAHFEKISGFSGFVKDADKDIIERLKSEDKLLFEEKIKHSYPLCWRCKSPLIFRLSEQLFFKVEEIKKTILEQNEKVKWYPSFALERFENWVINAEDWNISRQRYWGIPIPIWKSEDGEEIVISSKKELEKLSGKKISDLHVVDKLVIEKGKKKFKKVKGILDVWFDSGVAPWASLGYPNKNKTIFEKNFPVARINEAQDQIRGWFYSLMFCAAGVFEKPAFKEVSMTGWVLDKNGNKMSKSEGNVVTAQDALDGLGSDMLRFYFCWDIAPYSTQKFNMDIAKKEVGKTLNVLWNIGNLAKKGKVTEKDVTDRWILSRLESITKEYTEGIDSFEFHDSLRKINDFILNDLSRSYIQMNRDENKEAIVAHCLARIVQLLAPVSLFITEKIWQSLRDKNIVKEESVHLTSWPKYNSKKINKKLEEEFKVALEIVEKGLAARDKAGVGLKWPLASAVYEADKSISKNVENVVARQLNVKKLIKEDKSNNDLNVIVILNLDMTPELEAEGFSREIARRVQAERKNRGMKKEDKINLKLLTGSDLRKELKAHESFLKNRTGSKTLVFVEDKAEDMIEFKIKNKSFSFVF